MLRVFCAPGVPCGFGPDENVGTMATNGEGRKCRAMEGTYFCNEWSGRRKGAARPGMRPEMRPGTAKRKGCRPFRDRCVLQPVRVPCSPGGASTTFCRGSLERIRNLQVHDAPGKLPRVYGSLKPSGDIRDLSIPLFGVDQRLSSAVGLMATMNTSMSRVLLPFQVELNSMRVKSRLVVACGSSS